MDRALGPFKRRAARNDYNEPHFSAFRSLHPWNVKPIISPSEPSSCSCSAWVSHSSFGIRTQTTAANGFSDLTGKHGGYQESLEVWGRDGQPCRRCRGTVVVEKYEGQPSYRCAQCQI